jgi:hypothetical protein
LFAAVLGKARKILSVSDELGRDLISENHIILVFEEQQDAKLK